MTRTQYEYEKSKRNPNYVPQFESTETPTESRTKENKKVRFSAFKLFTLVAIVLVTVSTVVSTIDGLTSEWKGYTLQLDGYMVDSAGNVVAGPADKASYPHYFKSFNALTDEQKEDVREALDNGDYVIIPSI